MKVLVAIEFEGVDAEGEQADQIVDVLSEACESMGADFGASSCYIDDVEWTTYPKQKAERILSNK